MQNRQDEFDERFPQVDTIRAEYVLCSTGKGDHDAEYQYALDKRFIFESIKCTNRCCLNGEYKLWPEISAMISNREVIKEGSFLCNGNEGTKRNYKRCLDYIKYKITITYKGKQSED